MGRSSGPTAPCSSTYPCGYLLAGRGLVHQPRPRVVWRRHAERGGSEQREHVHAHLGRVDAPLDRAQGAPVRAGLRQVELHRLRPLAIRVQHHPHDGSRQQLLVVANHHRDLTGREPDERADREDPHHPHEGAHDPRVIGPARPGLQDAERLPTLLGLAVRALARHCVEAVGDRDEARRQGGLPATAERRISRAIERDVVFEDGSDGRMVRVPARDEDESGAIHGMTSDQPPLLLIERAVVLEDLRRDLDLADVVQQAADPQGDRLVSRQADRMGEGEREDADVDHVMVRVLVVRLHGREEERLRRIRDQEVRDPLRETDRRVHVRRTPGQQPRRRRPQQIQAGRVAPQQLPHARFGRDRCRPGADSVHADCVQLVRRRHLT